MFLDQKYLFFGGDLEYIPSPICREKIAENFLWNWEVPPPPSHFYGKNPQTSIWKVPNSWKELLMMCQKVFATPMGWRGGRGGGSIREKRRGEIQIYGDGTIWHLGQFDTDHARRTIWHLGQFDTIINFIFLQLLGPKIWLEIYWLPLSIFLTENYPV